MEKYVVGERISLKQHPLFNEQWVKDRIGENPEILGLGDLFLKAWERAQPRAGVLDLLLQEPDGLQRYEVEVQLGAMDPSHIIRTIEYWQIEQRRYPQYRHCAVLIAEDVTSRYLDVLRLFNAPLIVLQMTAIKHGDMVSLYFVPVLNLLERGPVDEDEDVPEPTDRAFWEGRVPRDILAIVDRLFEMVTREEPGLTPKYTKYYIGLARDGAADHFVRFEPRKGQVSFQPRLPESPETDAMLEDAGLVASYTKWGGRYRIKLTKMADVAEHEVVLTNLIRQARDWEREG